MPRQAGLEYVLGPQKMAFKCTTFFFSLSSSPKQLYAIEFLSNQLMNQCKNKKCEVGKVIDQNSPRIGKVHPSPFSDNASMVDWYHPPCFFDAMLRTLAKTPVPMSTSDIEGWDGMESHDQAEISKLLADFVVLRKAKLSGAPTPKKPKKTAVTTDSPAPKASTKASVAAPAADWFSPSKPTKPAAPKASSAPSTSSSDSFGLKNMLDKTWYTYLAPLIAALPNADSMLSTFSQNLPNKSLLFEPLRNLAPSDINLIIIKNRTFKNAAMASGYPFNAENDKTLEFANSELSSFLRAARSHSNAQGNHVDWESYNSGKPSSWFLAMKQQGVLFIHRELSSDPSSSVNTSTAWDAVVLKIIKTIFSEREKSGTNSRGVVIALVGEHLSQLKRLIQHIHPRFQEKVPIRIVELPNPESEEFSDPGNNPIETLDTFLVETENKALTWFPDLQTIKEQPKIDPNDEISSKSAESKTTNGTSSTSVSSAPGSFPALPPMGGKMTSRVQLTSMDGKQDLDVGKFHRNFEGKSGTFLMRSVDVDASDSTLSSHLGVFTMGSGGSISFKCLATNPIMHCNGVGNSIAKPISNGDTIELRRGDLLDINGRTYRVDPYNFAKPPTNAYVNGAGGNSSKPHYTNTSFMDEDDFLEPREKDAKRPFEDNGDDDDVFKPQAKKTKKTKKPAELDWLDDDEDEAQDADGDSEYKPPKHGESKYDHIIDDGEDSDAEEAAFFADKRPICMHGSECYRTNPAHLAQYRHPPKIKK